GPVVAAAAKPPSAGGVMMGPATGANVRPGATPAAGPRAHQQEKHQPNSPPQHPVNVQNKQPDARPTPPMAGGKPAQRPINGQGQTGHPTPGPQVVPPVRSGPSAAPRPATATH